MEAFLYGEQIGQTLLKQSDLRPMMICTDREPALAVREHAAQPVVLVLPPENSITVESQEWFYRIDRPHGGGPNLLTFDLGETGWPAAGAGAERRAIVEQFGELAGSFDLAEPFERIREAIEEAQQAVK